MIGMYCATCGETDEGNRVGPADYVNRVIAA